ncbi:MAG: Rrf2 family transcriptional regulator [Planctomycetota bacterium]|nr:MAG: Rrf2 family transcriptional regulator [Planctomycetota bacterium]
MYLELENTLWSQTSEYALRATTYIARFGENAPVLAREIADDLGISHQYLQKVLRGLVLAGILRSSRGTHGGFRLCRPATRVSLLEVIQPFDQSVSQSMCPFGNPHCGERNPCPVHEEWSKVSNAVQAFLKKTTLADLAAQPNRWVRRKGKRKATKRGKRG